MMQIDYLTDAKRPLSTAWIAIKSIIMSTLVHIYIAAICSQIPTLGPRHFSNGCMFVCMFSYNIIISQFSNNRQTK